MGIHINIESLGLNLIPGKAKVAVRILSQVWSSSCQNLIPGMGKVDVRSLLSLKELPEANFIASVALLAFL